MSLLSTALIEVNRLQQNRKLNVRSFQKTHNFQIKTRHRHTRQMEIRVLLSGVEPGLRPSYYYRVVCRNYVEAVVNLYLRITWSVVPGFSNCLLCKNLHFLSIHRLMFFHGHRVMYFSSVRSCSVILLTYNNKTERRMCICPLTNDLVIHDNVAMSKLLRIQIYKRVTF